MALCSSATAGQRRWPDADLQINARLAATRCRSCSYSLTCSCGPEALPKPIATQHTYRVPCCLRSGGSSLCCDSILAYFDQKACQAAACDRSSAIYPVEAATTCLQAILSQSQFTLGLRMCCPTMARGSGFPSPFTCPSTDLGNQSFVVFGQSSTTLSTCATCYQLSRIGLLRIIP